MPVGIRELKNKLSHYLKAVRQGEKLAVTDRGAVIAYITPAEKSDEYERLVRLIRDQKASWKGGKPAGSKHPAKTSGKPISQIVIEERR
jgi:prevent-host-death family protein